MMHPGIHEIKWSKNIPKIYYPDPPWCFNAVERHRKLHVKTLRYNGRDITLQEQALHNLATKVIPDYKKRIERPLEVVSSFRSCKLQCELCKEHDCPCDDGCSGIVAGAGKSGHQLAVCVDCSPPMEAKIPVYRHIFEEHGWQNFSGPGGSDANHWNFAFNG